jgi:hypothetical protein
VGYAVVFAACKVVSCNKVLVKSKKQHIKDKRQAAKNKMKTNVEEQKLKAHCKISLLLPFAFCSLPFDFFEVDSRCK